MKKNIRFNIFIIIIILCFLISLIILSVIGKKVLPVFMNYAVSEITNFSTIIINKSVNNHLRDFDNFDNMIIITKDKDDDIQMVDFNSQIVNHILVSTTESILEELKLIENGTSQILDNAEVREYSNGIIYEMPLGVIFNNFLFGNLGPKIPIKLNIVGDVLSNVKTDIKEYGINNVLIQVSINVELKEKVIIPFISETINVSTEIPVSFKIIQGNIPTYYGNGISTGSNILSIPTE